MAFDLWSCPLFPVGSWEAPVYTVIHPQVFVLPYGMCFFFTNYNSALASFFTSIYCHIPGKVYEEAVYTSSQRCVVQRRR